MTEISKSSIAAMRRSYGEKGLAEAEVPNEPIALFRQWLAEAAQNEVIVEANAMVLSTVQGDQPTSRTVLLKDVSDQGFSFFTNYLSRKGRQMRANAHVSLLFPWYAMERQVIVLGQAHQIPRAESEAYFATRPWSSQIGAWASNQSEILESRELLNERFNYFAEKYPEGTSVPTPEHWGGYVVQHTSVEFWQGRYSRLHDRIRFSAVTSGPEHDDPQLTGWKVQRFYP